MSWNIIGNNGQGEAGVSDTVTANQTSEIKEDRQMVLFGQVALEGTLIIEGKIILEI